MSNPLKRFLIVGLCLIAVAGSYGEPTDRPNIIFILADDLGWGDLGSYGHPRIKTPNLDRMAEEGIRFTQFYTDSVCSPTRAGIMTGQFPSRHGFHTQIFGSEERMDAMKMQRWLDPNVVQLPRVLQSAGYTTAHIGKWHLSMPKNRIAGVPSPESYGIDYARHPDFNWKELGLEWDARRTSELYVDQAIHFMDERTIEKPFFLQVWFNDPHNPYHPTEEHLSAYPNMPPHDTFTKYWSLVTEMDRQIGRLLEYLEQTGLSENTYVIFASDNGPVDSTDLSSRGIAGTGSAGPFRGYKGSLYEGGIRAPFIVRNPSHQAAGMIDEKTVLAGVDLLASFAAIAKADLPSGYESDGQDMSAAFDGHPQKRTKAQMWFYPIAYRAATISQSPVLAIREGSWKLLMNPSGDRVELYNLDDDLTETNNLTNEHTEIAGALSQQLLEWYQSLPANVLEEDAGTLTYPWPGQRWDAAARELK